MDFLDKETMKEKKMKMILMLMKKMMMKKMLMKKIIKMKNKMDKITIIKNKMIIIQMQIMMKKNKENDHNFI